MRAFAIAVAILSLTVLGVAVWWEWTPLHKGGYVRDNEHLIAQLKAYPGATVAGRYTSGYDNSTVNCDNPACFDIARTKGYETGVSYTLPRKVQVYAIVAWYARQLKDWADFTVAGVPRWRRGDQVLTVSTTYGQDEPTTSEYSVSADAHWARPVGE